MTRTTRENVIFYWKQGATIKTKSNNHLGYTTQPDEATKIIKTYFESEFFPEDVLVCSFNNAVKYEFSAT